MVSGKIAKDRLTAIAQARCSDLTPVKLSQPEKEALRIDLAEVHFPSSNAGSFFGDLSPFRIIVSAVALFTGLWTFAVVPLYWRFRRRPLQWFSADSLGVAFDPQPAVWTFNLRIVLANRTHFTATLTKLDALMLTPSGKKAALTWRLFFKYAENGSLVRDSEVYPIAVAPESCTPVFVQLAPRSAKEAFEAVPGVYTLSLLGFVNERKRPHLHYTRRFELTDNHLQMADMACVACEPFVTTIPFAS